MDFLIVVVIVIVAGVARWPVEARRHPKNGVVTSVVRVSSGRYPGLSWRWRHGRMTVENGKLILRPVGPLGIRFPQRSPLIIDVSEISRDRGSVGYSRMWSVNPLFSTTHVRTTNAVLELAAPPAGLRYVEAHIRDDWNSDARSEAANRPGQ